MRLEGPALYGAFDRFPSPKGAATHIGHFAAALCDAAGGGVLHCLGGPGVPAAQHEGAVRVLRHPGEERRELDRAVAFGMATAALVASQPWGTAQGRDPWSVLALLDDDRTWPVVYEVNGLPSIEVAERYPGAPRADLDRLARLEHACLAGADAVVTPSTVTADAVVARGAAASRVHVIPNGAVVPSAPPPPPPDAPDGPFVVYVGALQPWQGVPVALAALARIRDLGVPLVIVTGAGRGPVRSLERLAARAGIADLLRVARADGPEETARWLAAASVSVAPLRETRRNTEQGCCPLKIVESLAVATPVVASDLPAVRQEVRHGETGWLVPPDRPADLARALRVLLEHPQEAAALGRGGQAWVAAHRTWEAATATLVEVHAGVATGVR